MGAIVAGRKFPPNLWALRLPSTVRVNLESTILTLTKLQPNHVLTKVPSLTAITKNKP